VEKACVRDGERRLYRMQDYGGHDIVAAITSKALY